MGEMSGNVITGGKLSATIVTCTVPVTSAPSLSTKVMATSLMPASVNLHSTTNVQRSTMRSLPRSAAGSTRVATMSAEKTRPTSGIETRFR